MFIQPLRRRLVTDSVALSRRAFLSTQSTNTNPSSVPDPILNSTAAPHGARKSLNQTPQASQSPSGTASKSAGDALPEPSSTAPSKANTPLSDSVRTLLPLLRAQAPHYITTHIHAKPYLVTVGDSIRLPFLMHGVAPGDVLRLNRATVLGSRDYTLKAGAKPKVPKGSQIAGGDPDPGYIDDRLFVCRATVVGVVTEPLRVMEKTKRRQRHVKRVKSKHRYTVLKISELTVRNVDEVENESVKEA